MDDGIELNFAAPSGSGSGGAVRQVSNSKKGGRWTDRVKARRMAKESDRPTYTPAPAPAPAAPAPARAPAPAPVAAAPARPRPAPTPAPAPAPVVRDVPPHQAAPPASRPAAPTAAPVVRPTTSRPRPSVNSNGVGSPAKRPTVTPAARPAQTQSSRPTPAPVAGPSTSKTPQFISSLFTSNPARPSAKSAPPKPAPTFTGLPSNAPLGDTSTFAGLGLDPLLVRHLQGKMGVERPTGIQRSALPYMLASPLDIDARPDLDAEDENKKEKEEEGASLRDVFIQSQTGSGKTLTYLLPIVQTLLPLSRLSYIGRSIGTLAIILAPTRELAQQISKVLEQLLSLSLSTEDDDDTQYTRWLVSGLLTGGTTRTHEKARLRKGVPILVSTPGRLLDHLQNTTSFKCAKTMYLVLDEADRLMDLGFEETIHGIIRALEGRRKNEIGVEKEMDENGGGGVMRWAYWARGRRTVLCSATADAKVVKLAGMALRDPITFRAEPELPKTNSKTEKQVQEAIQDANAISLPDTTDEDKFTPPSQLSQKYVVVPTKLRLVSLVATLRGLIAAAKREATGTKIIVFLSSTDAVDFHWKLLGGVNMGQDAEQEVEAAPEPKARVAAKADGSDDDEAESADDDEDETAPKPEPTPKSKAKAKAASEELISLSSPLFPSTTINRLHGSLPLRTRMASLKQFATPSASHSILLATSVASRGLDLPLVRAVVQYDLPTEGGANEYVHRVGRTARAGKGGEAWAFVGPSEEPWVEWVEAKMGKAVAGAGAAEGGDGKGSKGGGGKGAGGGGVKLQSVAVNDILKRGFGGKGWEFEQRATDVQLGFERWVLGSDQNAALARKAYSSYIRAYSTHPAEEKRFFHPKSLHLGHLAKAFALREAPSSLAASVPSAKAKIKADFAAAAAAKKRKRDGEPGDEDEDEREGGKETTARNETEARMYAAVRKAGKQIRSQGKMGVFGGGDNEFQIASSNDVERMVSRR